jgi:hypothetical protein
MSKVEVNQISSQCGSTLTIGQSGDTVQLASGASQTGFGRTGTVDWNTTAKTASFTAVSGDGYFINTTSSAITVTLPASPSAGDIVSVKDYAYTFATNNCTIARNGSPIGGGSDVDLTLDVNGTAKTFVYVDGTKGWLVVNESTDTSDTSATYITATGGTVTTCGDFKIHTFTGPGTLCVSCGGNPAGNDQFEYLVVAGGGGSGGGDNNAFAGSGGGGLRFASPSLAPATYPGKPLAGSTLTAAAQAYPITVGSGGAGTGTDGGNNGSNSIFSSITSAGGGSPNCAGGSGGGRRGGSINNPGAAGNTPPVSPPQGQPGGASAQSSPDHAAGGGGGAIAAGEDGRSPANPGNSGAGGDGAGFPTAFGSNGAPCGSFRYYAGGGGGGGSPPGSVTEGAGGKGGGGSGGGAGAGTPGTANTGGGAGAGGVTGSPDTGGSGGSGIVVIRYKFQN